MTTTNDSGNPGSAEGLPTHPIWRSLELEAEQSARARIGRLRLEVHRSEKDWWVRTEEIQSSTSETESAERAVDGWSVFSGSPPDSTEPLPHGVELRRLLLAEQCVEVLPALADRPVIIRPLARMSVAPRSRVRLFVGTPLWVDVLAGGVVLFSRPIHRPSDTWFGNTFEGELCYSGRTQGRMRLANLQPLPARAITRVDIENASALAFDFDRLSLPVPSLSLYQSSDWIWTDSVTLVRSNEPTFANLNVHIGAPEEAGEARSLRPPRFRRGEGSRIRAFGVRALEALFG